MVMSEIEIFLKRRQRLLDDWQDATEQEKKKLLLQIMDLDEEIEFLKEKEKV